METKQFKAESKRLLDLMVNSIYTHKEIFLRELISNANDAIDKSYYNSLKNESITFNKEDFFIRITPNKDARTLTIIDTGVGMTKDELESNLGTIAKSGSLAFKQENECTSDVDIIGQFGVGFYSAFMVASNVTVISKATDSEAYRWVSDGIEGYTLEPYEKESVGTEIILTIKDNTDDNNYDKFLDEYHLKSLVKKYSDFIKYPIIMLSKKSKLKEGSENEYEDYFEDETLNSMVPIWRKNKSELTKDDYEAFYADKHFGFDKPLKYIHASVDGITSYNAIMYIPSKTPFNFYSKDYEKGLELYSNGVLIMEKCAALLPDHFSFVKGIVDSADLSLNISRELLQHDRQLQFIAKKLKDKIKSELISLQKNDRENYNEFYTNFGRHLKYGLYSEWGAHKEDLQDLIMFYSSLDKKLVTLDEYVSRMKDDQTYIYYATGENIARIDKLPQTELVTEKGYEILYFTEEVDEFAIKILESYKDKDFISVSNGDIKFDDDTEPSDTHNDLFAFMQQCLGDKVAAVKASARLKSHPVCLSSEGDVSIEMEKVLSSAPNNQGVKAKKVLEINLNHKVFSIMNNLFDVDKDKLSDYTKLLYNQALLIEGLPIDDPVEFSNSICKLF